MSRLGYKLHFGEPKTSRGRRSIRLDDQTAAALRAWRVQQAEEKLANGDVYRDGGLVFSSPVGEPIHPDRMSQMFERHAKRAGLPAIPLHGLRHAHASVLRAGVNPRVVQQRLGHSSVAFTLNVYSHVVPELEAEAAEKAAALVFRS